MWNILEKRPALKWGIATGWLLLIGWIAFFWKLGDIGLVDKTEAQFVEIARQIVVRNDWIATYWNDTIYWHGNHLIDKNKPFVDKPPLTFWLAAIGFKIMGMNEWAARLPFAFLAMAVIPLAFYTLYHFGFFSPALAQSPANSQKKAWLWLSALLGCSLIILNPAWIAWARTVVTDMPLSSTLTIALLAFFVGYAQPEKAYTKAWLLSVQQWWYFAFYAFMGLAVVAKGPVGFVLPVLIIGAFLLYVGKLREVWREIFPLQGMLIFLAVATPWYILMTIRFGEYFIDTFFGFHNFQRFTSVVSNHPGPWYYYIPVILVGFIPWSIYLPAAITRLRFWKRDCWLEAPRSAQLGLYALIWFVVVFVFFSLASTKLPSYVLPLIPAAVIMVTLLWSEQLQKEGKDSYDFRLFLATGIVNVLILVVLAVASFYSPQLVGNDPTVPQWTQVLQASGLPIVSGAIWTIAALATIVLLLRARNWRWLWATNLLGFMAFIGLVALPAARLTDNARQLPLRQLAALVKQERQPGEELVMIGFLKPSLVYYTGDVVRFIEDAPPAIEYLKTKLKSPGESATVLLLGQPRFLEKLALKSQDYQLIGKRGAYQLIRVSKRSFIK
jgi:4-amino-4-deoxy-L-arabinose transferase-like glycosyltransferase